MAQIIPGSSNEQYVWDKSTGSLQKILVSDSSVASTSNSSGDIFGFSSDSLKLLLTELKIPLYLIGAGLAVILLIILLERRKE